MYDIFIREHAEKFFKAYTARIGKSLSEEGLKTYLGTIGCCALLCTASEIEYFMQGKNGAGNDGKLMAFFGGDDPAALAMVDSKDTEGITNTVQKLLWCVGMIVLKKAIVTKTPEDEEHLRVDAEHFANVAYQLFLKNNKLTN